MSNTLPSSDNNSSIDSVRVTITSGEGDGAPSITVDYEIAKASPFVKDMIEMLSQASEMGGGDEAGSEGFSLPTNNVVLMEIDGPLFPTQEVLAVIRDFLLMNHKRAFTEVPKPVRESVFDTLRPDETAFLKKRVIDVDEFGNIPKVSQGQTFLQNVMQQTRSVFGGSPSAPVVATEPIAGIHPSNSAPMFLDTSINSSSAATTATSTNLALAATAPALDSAAMGGPHCHLFKLKVLRAALFLQLSPLVAAISGWFAWEMTTRVSIDRLAIKNAAALREFLGVDEDFTPEEKAVIERHTKWPGRS